MPRFYFHVRTHGTLKIDPEGADFETLELARDEAVRAAREIVGARIAAGGPANGDTFEITAEDGTIVTVLPFKSVIRLD